MALVLSVLLAQAASTVDEARRYFQSFEYQKAETLLREALSDGLEVAETIEAHEMLAAMYVAQDRDEDAVASYRAVLVVRPDYRTPPLLSPKLLVVLERARAEVATSRRSEAVPLQTSPTPADRSTLFDSVWFWAGLSVVAIGVASATYLYANPREPDGDFGPLPLPE
ncbi:MAG: hypothetical protein AAFQ65_13530 [Myxococcota bacterium]